MSDLKGTVEVPRKALYNALVVLAIAWNEGRIVRSPDTAKYLNQLAEADGMVWRFEVKS